MTLAPELIAPPEEYIAVTEEDEAETTALWAGNLPEWRLLVAPLGGTFRAVPPAGFADGTPAVVGHVEARTDRRAIIPPWRGSIIEWLVQDGDPVSPGQPLARLQPEGAE